MEDKGKDSHELHLYDVFHGTRKYVIEQVAFNREDFMYRLNGRTGDNLESTLSFWLG